MKRPLPRVDRGRVWKSMFQIRTSAYCNYTDHPEAPYWQLYSGDFHRASYDITKVPQDVVPDFDNFALVYKRFKNRK